MQTQLLLSARSIGKNLASTLYICEPNIYTTTDTKRLTKLISLAISWILLLTNFPAL